MQHTKAVLLTLVLTLVLIACGRPEVPDSYQTESRPPKIMPDYTDVTIPANICPLNFRVFESGKQVVARISVDDLQYTYGNKMKVLFDEEEWNILLERAKGGKMKVEVFVDEGHQWKAYQPFSIYVAKDDIDPYISYRLIQPAYVAYSDLSIAQRNLTNYDESDIYSNTLVTTPKIGQCINCHSYQNYRTDHMMFHMREGLPGTMIVEGKQLKKVNLKTPEIISAGVYPAWHPTQNLIAYSTNLIGQTFHTKDVAKVEVQDKESDLILYDVSKDEVFTISNDSNELETFPTWSADGNTLYYCSAHFEYQNGSTEDAEIIDSYKNLHYNIYARDFDQQTRTFSERRIIFDAASQNKSATLPRVSPDGKYLVFSLGNFGCFHVWHPEADIWLLNLETSEAQNLEALNSDRSDSYPSFSSNGRWIMTDSRRDDSNYTRPYIAYFDTDGNCHKAFELPQRDPEFYTLFLRSYNRPEFMTEPVSITPEQFAVEAKKDAKNVKYVTSPTH
ncbi:MAG: hypothetical protein K5899_07765 [Bacteroidaceae bacterium]|nr:hypothetical protein [Bacteroidaceae bacterium]